jgi:CBS domain-containing protein
MLAGRGPAISVTPATTVFEALQRMADHNIGAVLVMSGDRLVGIFSERDYARKVALRGLNSRFTLIGDLMTGKVITVGQSWTADQCMALMTQHHIRHLPVVDGDTLLGIISIGDAVKAVVDEQHFVIGQLTDYITRT